MSFDVKPGRGSERVKAWVYTILNPVIDSLRRETDLLKSGNLSWRVHSKRFEYIRPIAELIDVNQQPNLEDFLAEHPTFGERFNQHDSALAILEKAVTDYVEGLLRASDFREQVRESLDDYESRLREANPTYPDLREPRDKTAEYVAEFLANNSRSLPRHYTLYAFWKEYAAKFDAIFRAFAEPTYHGVKGKTQELLDISQRLRIDLEALRLALVREYDVPAAPLDPPHSVFQENASRRFR